MIAQIHPSAARDAETGSVNSTILLVFIIKKQQTAHRADLGVSTGGGDGVSK
jgi:hypothetical protein